MVHLPFAHPRAGTLDVDQWPELYAATSGMAELIVLRCPQCRDVPRRCRCALGYIRPRHSRFSKLKEAALWAASFVISVQCFYWQRYILPSSSFVMVPGWHLKPLRVA
jgi:hypothetical protein